MDYNFNDEHVKMFAYYVIDNTHRVETVDQLFIEFKSILASKNLEKINKLSSKVSKFSEKANNRAMDSSVKFANWLAKKQMKSLSENTDEWFGPDLVIKKTYALYQEFQQDILNIDER